MIPHEVADFKSSPMEKRLAEFCREIDKSDIDRIAQIADGLIKSPPIRDIAAFRRDNVYNWGRSGEVIADYLIGQANRDLQRAGSA